MPMKGPPSLVWNAIRNRFRPDEWSPRDDWRAERAGSPSDRILKSLERAAHDRMTTGEEKPSDEPRFLFAGTVGTGKSTELWKVAEVRARKGEEFVVFVNLVRHFGRIAEEAR